jgi:fatty acid desaturase
MNQSMQKHINDAKHAKLPVKGAIQFAKLAADEDAHPAVRVGAAASAAGYAGIGIATALGATVGAPIVIGVVAVSLVTAFFHKD